MIGTNELLVIFGILVVLFGASKVPEFARSLGKAKGEFEKALKEAELEVEKLEEEKKRRKDLEELKLSM